MIEIWKCTLNISAEHRKSYYREGYLKKKLNCPKTGGGGVYGQDSLEQQCDPDLETILTEQQGSWRVLTA